MHKKKVLLFLGGLKKRKNPVFLINLFKRLNNKDLVLIIAGDGPLRKEMQSRTKKNALSDRVIFTGFVSENKKTDFYNLADIVLLPSLKEGFGMIAAEAGACGKTVIASDNSSLKEIIINGKTGFLAKTNDIDDWIKKINSLIANQSAAKNMGWQARQRIINKFNWNKNIASQLKVYQKYI